MAAKPDESRQVGLREERKRQQERLSTLHILDAAEEVFAAKGFVGATIREIADEAEFSVGSIYTLFAGGKDEVFVAVITRRTREFVSVLDDALQPDIPPIKRLHEMIDAILDYYAAHSTFYRLFQRAIGGDWLKFEATASDSNWQDYQTILDRYAALFRDGIGTGDFIDDDPAAQAVILAGILQSFLAHRIVGLGPHNDSIDSSFPAERLHALIDRTFGNPNKRQARRTRGTT